MDLHDFIQLYTAMTTVHYRFPDINLQKDFEDLLHANGYSHDQWIDYSTRYFRLERKLHK